MPPPATRSDDHFMKLLESKFDELRLQLIKDTKEALVAEIKEEVRNFMKKQNVEILKLNSGVEMLQQQVTELKHQNLLLSQHSDDNEQYGRRLCLRIEGLPTVKNETEADVFVKIKKLIDDSGCKIPNLMIDRAHRIGPRRTDDDGIGQQSVIARFVSFRHRTLLYNCRKKLKEKKGISIRLDLTKRKHDLLKLARDKVKDDNLVSYAYADVNCRLKVKFADGNEKSFASISQLKVLLGEDCET